MNLVEESVTHREAIKEELGKILASPTFSSALRSQALLRYLVERSQASSPPKEYEIAVEVLGRSADYNPAVDATVRVEAGRLRTRLREYYSSHGQADPVLIEIPKGGYAAVFRVRPPEPAIAPAPSPGAPPPQAPQPVRPAVANSLDPSAAALTSRSFNRRWFWLPIAAAIVLSAATAFRLHRLHLQPHGPIRSLAVLQLDNLSGNADQQYFADGMTDALITELAQIHELRVVSRTSVMHLKTHQRSLQQIASDLDVDAVVEGSIVRVGNRVRITAQLIDTRDDRHLWSRSYEEEMTDVIGLEGRIAREIAQEAEVALAPAASGSASRPIHPAAWDAYMRGLYFFNRRDADRSSRYFEQAISIDQSFAPAYAGLAAALDARRVLTGTTAEIEARALTAAEQAIRLDPRSGEAYTARGFIEMGYRQWPAAQKDFEQAIAFSPNNSLAHVGYAIYLDAANRPEEAVTHMRRAVQLDPLSFFANRHLGSTLYFARHYDEALAALNRAAEIGPDRPNLVADWASRANEMKGNLNEAMRLSLTELETQSPGTGALRSAYQRGNWPEYQHEKLRFLLSGPAYGCRGYDIGVTYLRLGDSAKAAAHLARGVAESVERSCFWFDSLPVDPILDNLRHEPVYSALLKRANMTP